MRKLISLEELIERAREDNTDLRDLAVDEDDVFDIAQLDNDLAENPTDADEED